MVNKKKILEYHIYYRDHLTQSMTFLGKIRERRKKERGNNLQDLLKKARMDYAHRVKDPSAICLFSP